MRFLIIGDLHGRQPVIPKQNFDIVIVPGDVCGDEGIRDAYMTFYREFLKNKDGARPWHEIMGKRDAKTAVLNNVKQGRKTLEQLDKLGVPIIFVPGNWDYSGEPDSEWAFLHEDFFHTRLTPGLKNLVVLDKEVAEVNDISIIGYGWCNGPELLDYRINNDDFTAADRIENRMHYDELRHEFDALFTLAEHPVIFVTHNVPYKTKLDKVLDENSPAYGKHYGSVLAKEMTKKHQPIITIGAHMHEYFDTTRLGKSLVLNAGFGPEKHSLLEVKDGKVVLLELYDGDELVKRIDRR